MQSRSSIKWKRTGAPSSSKTREVRAPETPAIKQYHHVRQNSTVTKRSLLVSLCCVSRMTEEGSEVWDDDPVLKPSHALSANVPLPAGCITPARHQKSVSTDACVFLNPPSRT